MRGGKNVFLTGPPGSGKSYVIEQFVSLSSKESKKVALTATTGIAANLLGGVTIHSWSGMGLTGLQQSAILARLIDNPSAVSRIRTANILIIDEISMFSADQLDRLNLILKTVRVDPRTFGGLQVIVSGDFFQLPPVGDDTTQYAFSSKSWRELNFEVCYLSEQYRQTDDRLYEVLRALRDRSFSKNHLGYLLERQLPHVNVGNKEVTMLLTHNSDVNRLNMLRLDQIKEPQHLYTGCFSGAPEAVDGLTKSVLAPLDLRLKVGARVMFVANEPSRGFVNGTQGKVINFKSGLPVVLTDDGLSIKVEARSWTFIQDNQVLAKFEQLPLKLAWAITIHKCQGMSLDNALIDLRRSFTYGMGYVALSRLKSYEGLYLLGINTRSLLLDPVVYKFDATLRRAPAGLTLHQKNSSIISRENDAKALLRAGLSKRLINLTTALSLRQIETLKKQLLNE